MQQPLPDWIPLIKEWREHLPDLSTLSEAQLIQWLSLLEDRTELDNIGKQQVEAFLLALLAAKRLQRPNGWAQAEEWLTKARKLDPHDPYAANLVTQLYLHRLRKETVFREYPPIRETDNAVSKRKQLEQLQQRVSEEMDQTDLWQDLLHQAKEAAIVAGDPELESMFADGQTLFQQRITLLVELKKSAEAYAASLQGMFYSTSLLAELQTIIRRLQEQQEQIALLWQDHQQVAENEHPSALQEIEGLVGLDEIKKRVRQLADFHQYQRLRRENGWVLQDQPELHLVLMGNPGTGKTTLARQIAKLYQELGLLEVGHMVEVDRSQLVGGYVGQTEQRTMEAIQRAVGGVLFIDEAYSLKREDTSGNDYGQVVIDTMVAAMTSGEYAGRFVVILAGYPEEMRSFLHANPGLRSRFPESGYFTLPNYTEDQLITIAEQVAQRNDFSLLPETKIALRRQIERAKVDETFGNARTIKNMVLDAIFAKAEQIREKEKLALDDFTILYPEDISHDEKQEQDQDHTEKLEALIGLSEIKTEMKKIGAFLSIQKRRMELGLPAVPIELHALFCGNAGTGKSTVAGYYASILQETGYLKRGHLVTVSRADLVAGYVGQSAIQTKRVIRDALGGVLFIDEAYSLQSANENDYGQEVIHTLVDEMTRHQENLVVVLAGYPEEMKRLIASNPGLASRFKKWFLFPDYSADELLAILDATIRDSQYHLPEQVLQLVEERLHEQKEKETIAGNARYVKNLVQEAIQNQALRLADIEPEQLSREMLRELQWEDFAQVWQD